MKICLRENEFNPSFIALYGEEIAKEKGYTIVEVDEKYQDCCFEDFENFVFSVEKYNARKLNEENQKKIPAIRKRLNELNKDFIQKMLGAVIPNIEEKEAEFISLHNELRVIQGKEPREYNK